VTGYSSRYAGTMFTFTQRWQCIALLMNHAGSKNLKNDQATSKRSIV
jgi:hypothetical protein